MQFFSGLRTGTIPETENNRYFPRNENRNKTEKKYRSFSVFEKSHFRLISPQSAGHLESAHHMSNNFFCVHELLSHRITSTPSIM